ncbi:MAG: hypothetical protein V3S69_02645 [Dehalococcoidales bacterium]
MPVDILRIVHKDKLGFLRREQADSSNGLQCEGHRMVLVDY